MNQTLVVLIGIGTGLAALGLLVQLALWFLIYGTGRRIQRNVMGMTPKVQSLLASAKTVYREVRVEVIKIRDDAKDAIAVTKRDIATLHHLRDDTMRVMQHERDLADEVLQDAVGRARQTSRMVGRGITTPIRGIAQVIRRLRHAA